MVDPKERFSSRVDDYRRFRPSYPRAALDLVVGFAGLAPGRAVADMGAGTGLWSRMLLESGAEVVAVEPNAEMRTAAEALLQGEAHASVVGGSAESSGLADRSVDLVTAAQAFHWFEPRPARAEFARIARPPGLVALLWNLRQKTPFQRDYEDLLVRFAPDYANVRMRERADEPYVSAFFAPERAESKRFDHEQRLDRAALRGRLLSSSYAPAAGQAGHEPMLRRLGEIFDAHARDGVVRFAYETVVWYGRLGP